MNPERSHSLDPEVLARMLEEERLQFADEYALFLYGTGDIEDTLTEFAIAQEDDLLALMPEWDMFGLGDPPDGTPC